MERIGEKQTQELWVLDKCVHVPPLERKDRNTPFGVVVVVVVGEIVTVVAVAVASGSCCIVSQEPLLRERWNDRVYDEAQA